MISRVDLSVTLFPGVVAAPLVLGTISGCGGKVVVDAMMFGWGSMPGKAEISEPGFVSRSAFVASLVYYVIAHAAALVEPRAAAGLVVTGLVGARGRQGAGSRGGAATETGGRLLCLGCWGLSRGCAGPCRQASGVPATIASACPPRQRPLALLAPPTVLGHGAAPLAAAPSDGPCPPDRAPGPAPGLHRAHRGRHAQDLVRSSAGAAGAAWTA
jgi:hypothetical protein